MAIGVDAARLKAALQALNSAVCVCGAAKPSRRSFCRACYFRLPWHNPVSNLKSQISNSARCDE